jgi:nucleotide-binding universal stress UspA family protein
MKGSRKILVAVNWSMDVLRQGIALSRDEKTWITVLKVIPPYEGDVDLTGIGNIGDVLDGGGRKVAAEIAGLAESERVLIKTRIEEGEIEEKIVEVAEEEQSDLIIMGPTRKKGLRRFFGNNLARKVMNRAPCPVLIVGS